MKIFNLLTACAVTMVLATSCEHKDLCYDHSHSGKARKINVVFDWRNAPDANPETMSLYLYPKSGGEGARYDFVGRDGGTLSIAAGEYVAVCINSDTRQINFNQPESGTFATAADRYLYFYIDTDTAPLTYSLDNLTEAKAASAPRAKGSESERVAYAPDVVWTDSQTEISITETDETQTITLYPQLASCRYTLNLQNISNCDYVYEMSATLSGMAGGLYVAQRQPTDEVVTFPLGLSVDKANAAASGALNTFGDCPDDVTHTHTVVIYAVMSDGSTYYYVADVTDQVHNAPDPYNVVIDLKDIPLPLPETPSSGGSGSSISVEGWENITQELKM